MNVAILFLAVTFSSPTFSKVSIEEFDYDPSTEILSKVFFHDYRPIYIELKEQPPAEISFGKKNAIWTWKEPYYSIGIVPIPEQTVYDLDKLISQELSSCKEECLSSLVADDLLMGFDESCEIFVYVDKKNNIIKIKGFRKGNKNITLKDLYFLQAGGTKGINVSYYNQRKITKNNN